MTEVLSPYVSVDEGDIVDLQDDDSVDLKRSSTKRKSKSRRSIRQPEEQTTSDGTENKGDGDDSDDEEAGNRKIDDGSDEETVRPIPIGSIARPRGNSASSLKSAFSAKSGRTARSKKSVTWDNQSVGKSTIGGRKGVGFDADEDDEDTDFRKLDAKQLERIENQTQALRKEIKSRPASLIKSRRDVGYGLGDGSPHNDDDLVLDVRSGGIQGVAQWLCGEKKRTIDIAIESAWEGNTSTIKSVLNGPILGRGAGERHVRNWLFRLARIAGKAGHPVTMTTVLTDDRLRNTLEQKGYLDLSTVLKLGFKFRAPMPEDIAFLSVRGFQYDQTPKEQILAAICRGGKIEAATAFFAHLGNMLTNELIKKHSFAGDRRINRVRTLRSESISYRKMRFSKRKSVRRSSGAGSMVGLSVIEGVRLKLEEDLSFLAVAAKRGNLSMMNYLCDTVGFDLAYEAQTTLDVACRGGQPHVVEYLLNKFDQSVAALTVDNVIWSENTALAEIWVMNCPKGAKKIATTRKSQMLPRTPWNNTILMCDECQEHRRQYMYVDKQLCRKCSLETTRITGEDYFLELANADVFQQLEDAMVCLDITEDEPHDFYDIDGMGPEDYDMDRLPGFAVRLLNKVKGFVTLYEPYHDVQVEKERQRLSFAHRRKKEDIVKTKDRRELLRAKVFAHVIRGAVEAGSVVGNGIDTTLATVVALVQWHFCENRIVKAIFDELDLRPNASLKDHFLWSCSNNPQFALYLVEESSDLLDLTQDEIDFAFQDADSFELVEHLAYRFDRPAQQELFDEAVRYENFNEALEILRKSSEGLNFKKTDHLLQVINRNEPRLALALLAHPTVDPTFPGNKPFIAACELGITVLVKMYLSHPEYIKIDDPNSTAEEDDEDDDCYLCNGCRQRIVDSRFHCLVCDNFDLCEDCHTGLLSSKGSLGDQHDHTHAMLQVENEVFHAALSVAVRGNHLAIVKLLAEDRRFNSWTHLIEAVKCDLHEMVRLILNINDFQRVLNTEFVMKEAIMRSIEVVQALLDDKRFLPPTTGNLDSSISCNNRVAASLLLSKGAPINWESSQPDLLLPVILLQSEKTLETIFNSAPKNTWFDLNASCSEGTWKSVSKDQLRIILLRKELCPRTPEQVLGMITLFIQMNKSDLLEAIVKSTGVSSDWAEEGSLASDALVKYKKEISRAVQQFSQEREKMMKILSIELEERQAQDHGLSAPWEKQFVSAQPQW